MSVGFDTNVNYSFTYQELQDAVTKSTYNRGELTLSKDGNLNVVNNHVIRVWKNGTVTSRTENARIRSAVYKAIAAQYQQDSGNAAIKNFLNEVRRVLFAEGRAGEALSRDEVRNLLNADKKEGWISLRSRQIRAIKTTGASVQLDGDKKQVLGDVIHGYNVKTLMNSSVLKPTKNKSADSAWQQSLETAKSSVQTSINNAHLTNRDGTDLTQQTKDALINHFNLLLEDRWATAATKSELPTVKDIQRQVNDFLNGESGRSVLNSIDDLSRKQSFVMQQLALSGIDLIDVGEPYSEDDDRMAALADVACNLTEVIMEKGYDLRTICEAQAKKTSAVNCKNVMGENDLNTMTRLQLQKTCVAFASLGNGAKGVAALHAGDVTLDDVLNSGKMPKDGNKAKAIETAMKGPQGQRLLSILQGGVFAYGPDKAKATEQSLANLLGKIAKSLPQDMSDADILDEMQNTIRDVADCLGNPPSSPLKAFVTKSDDPVYTPTHRMFNTFRQLRYDRQRVNVVLSGFGDFMAQRIGENWRVENPGLSNYVDELERTAKKDLTFMVGDEFNVSMAEHAQRLRAPQLAFKLEQMKEVISLLAGQQTENPGEVALSIVKGENLGENEKAILAKANGMALLNAIDTERSDKSVIWRVSWPLSNSPEKTELLKKLLLPHAYEFCAGRANLKIETAMDLQEAWKELLGDPSAQDKNSLVCRWNNLYVGELDKKIPRVFEPAEDKPNAEFKVLVDSGIDLTKVDVKTISNSCKNELLVGFFIHALLSRQNAGLETLNQQIKTISKLTPESVGLDVTAMTDNEKQLFALLKWSIPEFSLNGKGDAEIHPLKKIFTEIQGGLNSITPAGISENEINDFRTKMMKYLLTMKPGEKEFVRMIQRQVAEAADPSIESEKKFTVAGHLQSALTELGKTQAAFNQAAAEYMDSHAQYIDQELDLPSTRQNYVKEQLGVVPTDCDPKGNYQKIADKTEHLKKRSNIITNRIKQVNYVKGKVKEGVDPNVGQAAIRMILNTNRSAFVDNAGVDLLISSLTDLAQKQSLSKWKEELSAYSQQKNKGQVIAVLTEMFNETVQMAVSFFEQSKTIFPGKSDADIGADEKTAMSENLTLEFLGFNRDLSRIVNEVVKDEDVKQALEGLREKVKGEPRHMAGGWGHIVNTGALSNWLKHFDSPDKKQQGK